MFKKNRVLSDRRGLLRFKWVSAGEMNAVLYLNLTKIAAKVVQSVLFFLGGFLSLCSFIEINSACFLLIIWDICDAN